MAVRRGDVMPKAAQPRTGSRGADLEQIRARVHQQVVQAGNRAFDSPPRGGARPPRVVSDAERHGVPSTDTEARSPLGVGASLTGRAEKMAQQKEEPGRRRRVGEEHPARRPYGVSEPHDATGVGDHRPIHEESPVMPSGDQGG
ncbi:hypothetical protein [Sphaerisporangium fuscum]|uniref:hypothetical protein n=1 Tax=Sphaerisporangium fuscum TaxID=2835868 RepID=UPI001BDC454B|nr:hypothetical protein [Sphaerisporangium fuscum]